MDRLDEKADPVVANTVLRFLSLRGVIAAQFPTSGATNRATEAARRGSWRAFANAVANVFWMVAHQESGRVQLANFIRNGELDFSTDDLETAVLYASLDNFFGWSLPPGHPRRTAGPEDAEGAAESADPGDG